MAYACDICGKGKQFGKNVPFSLKKTNKVWKPNLQKQYVNLGDSRLQLKICTQCIRTLKKYRAQNEQAIETADAAAVEAKAEATTKPAARKATAKKPAAKKTAARKPAAAKAE